MRPPLRRYSSVSRQNQHVEPLPGLGDRGDDLVQRRALLGGAGGGDHQTAEPAGAGLAVDHLDPARGPLSASDRAASRALSQVPERPLAMWMETTSRPAVT